MRDPLNEGPLLLLRTIIRRSLHERAIQRRFATTPTVIAEDPLAISRFKRPISKDQLLSLSSLLDGFVETAPAPFFLAFGSLLGAAIYQDRIPWDDDFDLFCFASDHPKIKAAFERDGRFRWLDEWDRTGRFLRKSKICWRGSAIEGHLHGWPFIDIFWLVECCGRLLERTSALTFAKREFDNAPDLTFGSRRLAVPHNYDQLLSRSFPCWKEWVVFSSYSHITETEIAPHALKIRRLEADKLQRRFLSE